MKKVFSILFLFFTSIGCTNHLLDVQKIDMLPDIYPKYTNIVIPPNIAPLNFMFTAPPEAGVVYFKNGDSELKVESSRNVEISINEWKNLVDSGDSISITVFLKRQNKWFEYQSFFWKIAKEPIDAYLSYRLIEPGYEVYNTIQLCERNIENFEVSILADNNLTNGSCMNCHIYGPKSNNISFFHLRGDKGGGTILNRNGKLQKYNLKTEGMISPAVYGDLHPDRELGVFSSNKIIPELHAYGSRKLEVYDLASNVFVVDFQDNCLYSTPLLSNDDNLETFPTFNAKGDAIYFCTAPKVILPDSIESLKYSLCKIQFDPETISFGEKVDTLIDGAESGLSVSHIKASPDGKFLLYSVSDYGTFPIWHAETDLNMLELASGKIDKLKNVNDKYSDSYHSWSSNSRWFVFASKRDDGIYGKPYFCYVDSKGRAHKPFVLPQKNPAFYENTLKSFNIPELSNFPANFNAMDIEKIFKRAITINVKQKYVSE
ncbi:MAG: hypothetical protein PWQ06_571 [Anaerophaga sp.]|nr:hypothetical protein [Anaerophaga sp.]